MTRIEETKEEARQGVTSRGHRVLTILIVSTTLAGLALFLGAALFV